MPRNRPMPYMCKTFIKCAPLKASEIISAVKLSPHQGTLKLLCLSMAPSDPQRCTFLRRWQGWWWEWGCL